MIMRRVVSLVFWVRDQYNKKKGGKGMEEEDYKVTATKEANQSKINHLLPYEWGGP